MAKKKSEKPPVPAAAEPKAEPKAKPVRLDMTPEEHHELRAVAGLNGLSMSAYAHDVLVRAVREELKRRGIKL